jgi:amino-acid N-acetyltransferase
LKKSTRRRTPLLRTAVRSDAKRIHELIEQNRHHGRLLPRELGEVTAHVDRFVVGVDGRGSVVACGELAPLSAARAEIRSLVVTDKRRGEGLGRRVVEEIRRRARLEGFDDLCVFAHQPAYFVHLGFSIVPHTWLPEKLAANCRACPLFRRCDQFALVSDLDLPRESQSSDSVHV